MILSLLDLGSRPKLLAQELPESPLLPDPSLLTEGRCRQSKPNYWLCAGNTAWHDGFLIPKNLMEDLINSSNLLPEIVKERNDYRILLIESTSQRDSYKELYESERNSYNSLSTEVTHIISQRDSTVDELEKSFKKNEEITRELEKSHSTLELWLISGATALVFASAGAIVGVYLLD